MASDRSAPAQAQGPEPAEPALDFESALAELETLVAKMEDGGLALDDSLRAYQRGVELARICQQRLDVAEEQVRVLQGSLLRPLDDSAGGDT